MVKPFYVIDHVDLRPEIGPRFFGPEEECIGPAATDLQNGWTVTVAGNNAACSPDATHSQATGPGQIVFTTGTQSSGIVAWHSYVSGLLFGGGEMVLDIRFRIEDLATVAQDFACFWGFGDTTSSYLQTDGFGLEYDRATSANFSFVTANNGTRTRTTSSTAVAEDTWYWLRLAVNAGGTSAQAWLGTTEAGLTSLGSAITTNIPTSVGREFGLMCIIDKAAGTTARRMWVDLSRLNGLLTAAR